MADTLSPADILHLEMLEDKVKKQEQQVQAIMEKLQTLDMLPMHMDGLRSDIRATLSVMQVEMQASLREISELLNERYNMKVQDDGIITEPSFIASVAGLMTNSHNKGSKSNLGKASDCNLDPAKVCQIVEPSVTLYTDSFVLALKDLSVGEKAPDVPVSGILDTSICRQLERGLTSTVGNFPMDIPKSKFRPRIKMKTNARPLKPGSGTKFRWERYKGTDDSAEDKAKLISFVDYFEKYIVYKFNNRQFAFNSISAFEYALVGKPLHILQMFAKMHVLGPDLDHWSSLVLLSALVKHDGSLFKFQDMTLKVVTSEVECLIQSWFLVALRVEGGFMQTNSAVEGEFGTQEDILGFLETSSNALTIFPVYKSLEKPEQVVIASGIAFGRVSKKNFLKALANKHWFRHTHLTFDSVFKIFSKAKPTLIDFLDKYIYHKFAFNSLLVIEYPWVSKTLLILFDRIRPWSLDCYSLGSHVLSSALVKQGYFKAVDVISYHMGFPKNVMEWLLVQNFCKHILIDETDFYWCWVLMNDRGDETLVCKGDGVFEPSDHWAIFSNSILAILSNQALFGNILTDIVPDSRPRVKMRSISMSDENAGCIGKRDGALFMADVSTLKVLWNMGFALRMDQSFYTAFGSFIREIGDGSWDSWTWPLFKQTAIACEKVRNMTELRDGYNMVGLSQGNMVGRGVIEFCDGAPPVKNFISLAGPHAGTASVPFCGSGIICILIDFLMKLEVYSNYVQEHLAPSGYIKIPTDISGYIEGCKFLPKLNNELKNERNSTYKERFSSLENLVLIMFEQDTVLIPKETAWFGYYPDGAFDPILPVKETALYKEDWIGLKTLDEAGKVKFVNVTGNHLGISKKDMKKYIVPYLEDQSSVQQIMTECSSHKWLSSVRNFFLELIGLGEDLPLLRIR